jgi:hypothetical protein
MIWSYTSPDQSKWMRVSIVNVYSNVWNILQYLLCTVEASRSATYDGKSILLVRLYLMLSLDTLFEILVVVLGHIETETS